LKHTTCQPDGQLIMASAFKQLKPACQQSWSQSSLLCRTMQVNMDSGLHNTHDNYD